MTVFTMIHGGLFMNGQVRQYVVDNDRLYGTKGIYNVILTRKLLDNPELYVSYSYYRSHFKYDDENYTPIALVQNESNPHIEYKLQ